MSPLASRIMTTLQTRLLQHGSEEAMKMTMRPELQQIEAKLKELLWKTVLEDENASVLLYGYPGVGKTLVVERALRALVEEVNGEIPVLCVVRLNGALEGDKTDGFKSIARQLCAFMDVKFLSHVSADRNIKFLKVALKKLHQAHRCCVFVLDVFERFVRDSEKQEIVYTLLDALQRRDVRASVIGMTTDFQSKTDFDKRVYSRFSHKAWMVPKCGDALPLLPSMLKMPVTKENKKRIEKYNRSVDQAISDASTQEWFKTEKGRFGVRDARAVALLTISNAAMRGERSFKVESNDVQMAVQECIHSHDPHTLKISQMAIPHLYMLVACQHLQPGFTYKTAFAKYECFIRTQNTCDVFDAPIMTQAFEDLVHEDIISCTRETKHKEILVSPFDLFSLNVTRDEIQQGILRHPFLSTMLHVFFKSE